MVRFHNLFYYFIFLTTRILSSFRGAGNTAPLVSWTWNKFFFYLFFVLFMHFADVAPSTMCIKLSMKSHENWSYNTVCVVIDVA